MTSHFAKWPTSTCGGAARHRIARWRRHVVAAGFMAVALTVPLLTTAPALALDVIDVDASVGDEGGRMVFAWDAPVRFTTTVDDRRLLISFDRPLATTFEAVEANLGAYIREIVIGPDGRSILALLEQPVSVVTATDGGNVIVDLVPRTPPAPDPAPPVPDTAVADAAGSPPPASSAEVADAPVRVDVADAALNPNSTSADAPADPTPGLAPPRPPRAEIARQLAQAEGDAPIIESGDAAAAETPPSDAPPLSVRFGIHDEGSYDRIVFDWPVQVPFEVENDDGLITISFDRPAQVNAERLSRRFPPWLALVGVDNPDGRLQMQVATNAGATVRGFYVNTKAVFDIRRDPAGPRAAVDPDVVVARAEGTLPAQPPTDEALEDATAESPEPAEVAVAEPPALPPVPPDSRASQVTDEGLEPADVPEVDVPEVDVPDVEVEVASGDEMDPSAGADPMEVATDEPVADEPVTDEQAVQHQDVADAAADPAHDDEAVAALDEDAAHDEDMTHDEDGGPVEDATHDEDMAHDDGAMVVADDGHDDATPEVVTDNAVDDAAAAVAAVEDALEVMEAVDPVLSELVEDDHPAGDHGDVAASDPHETDPHEGDQQEADAHMDGPGDVHGDDPGDGHDAPPVGDHDAAADEPVEMAALDADMDATADQGDMAADADGPDAHGDVDVVNPQAPPADLTIDAIGGDEQMVLRLRWSQPVHGAVFARAGWLWMVFDHDVNPDLSSLEIQAGGIVGPPVLEHLPDATILRMTLDGDVAPRVRAANDTWFVQLRPGAAEPESVIPLNRIDDPVMGPAISFDVAGGGPLLMIEDPNVGDTLAVVPVGQPGYGRPAPAQFIEFRVLATAQGLAVERVDDAVTLLLHDGAAQIVSPVGLNLSSAVFDDHGAANHDAVRDPGHANDHDAPQVVDHDADYDAGHDEGHPDDLAAADDAAHHPDAADAHGAPDTEAHTDGHAEVANDHGAPAAHDDQAGDHGNNLSDNHGAPNDAGAQMVPVASPGNQPPDGPVDWNAFRLFDIPTWQRSEDGTFLNVRRHLERVASQADDDRDQFAARRDLARFLFAHERYTDALGVLRLIESDMPSAFTEDPSLLALRGAAAMMMNDLVTAEADLSSSRLALSPEARLWHAATLSRLDRFDEARALFQPPPVVPPWYPAPLQGELGGAAVDTALADGDYERATRIADSLPFFLQDTPERAELDLRRARILWLRGDHERAVDLWQELEDGDHASVAAFAGLARLSALIEGGMIAPETAIAELETLRFRWRGDGYERRVIEMLADMYAAAGDYRNALRTLDQMTIQFSNAPDIEDIQAALEATFAELFSPDPPGNVSPITAVALFDEYHRLVPEGPEGEAMSRRLADRLIGLNLLAEAAEILQSEVDERLTGNARGAAGARIALIHLANRDPEAALAALSASESENMPDALVGERRRLAASAHLELGDLPTVVETLVNDASRNADLLRAEAYWRSEDWARAAEVFERLVGQDMAPAEPEPVAVAPDPPEPVAAEAEEVDDPQAPALAEAADGLDALPTADEAAAMDLPAMPEPEDPAPLETAAGADVWRGPLSDFQARQLVNWAMALTYARDQAGLSMLDRRFSAAMAGSPHNSLFQLLVADDLSPIANVGDVDRLDPDIARFESFITSYRERLMDSMGEALPSEDDMQAPTADGAAG